MLDRFELHTDSQRPGRPGSRDGAPSMSEDERQRGSRRISKPGGAVVQFREGGGIVRSEPRIEKDKALEAAGLRE